MEFVVENLLGETIQKIEAKNLTGAAHKFFCPDDRWFYNRDPEVIEKYGLIQWFFLDEDHITIICVKKEIESWYMIYPVEN